jgi:hypothetical protein
MVEDYRNQVGEDDLTHLPEILALHDLAKDKPAGSPEQFRQRCMENALKRAMHHHVFDTSAALQLIDYAGFAAIRTDRIKPHHIVVLSRRRQGPADKGRSPTNYGGHSRSAPGFCG